jgi:hypothetical protein
MSAPEVVYAAAVRWVFLVCITVLGCKASTGISRDLGAACRSLSDCTSRCLPDPEFPNGFCSRDCQGDGDCPSEARCVQTDQGKVCLFACADDKDCSFLGSLGKSWTCQTVDTKLVCAGQLAPLPDGGTRD